MTAGLVATAAAQEDNLEDDSEVDVNVASEISVDMDPDTLIYGDVFPGDEQTTDDNNIDRVQIENVGSTEIDRVYMGAETPNNTAFGTGDATQYLATNFLEINVSNYEGYDFSGSINAYDYPVYVNRKEFPEINDLSYIFVEDETNWEYGRFRVGENEYFWALETGDFSAGDLELRVGNTPHTQEDTGTQDFTNDGPDYETYVVSESTATDEDGNSVGIAENVLVGSNGEVITEGTPGEHREYDVVVQPDDSAAEPVYVTRSRFNAEYEGVDLTGVGATDDYIFDSASGDVLEPGDSFQVGTQVRVPRGVASGDVGTGVLTVTVESDGDGAESE